MRSRPSHVRRVRPRRHPNHRDQSWRFKGHRRSSLPCLLAQSKPFAPVRGVPRVGGVQHRPHPACLHRRPSQRAHERKEADARFGPPALVFSTPSRWNDGRQNPSDGRICSPPAFNWRTSRAGEPEAILMKANVRQSAPCLVVRGIAAGCASNRLIPRAAPGQRASGRRSDPERRPRDWPRRVLQVPLRRSKPSGWSAGARHRSDWRKAPRAIGRR